MIVASGPAGRALAPQLRGGDAHLSCLPCGAHNSFCRCCRVLRRRLGVCVIGRARPSLMAALLLVGRAGNNGRSGARWGARMSRLGPWEG